MSFQRLRWFLLLAALIALTVAAYRPVLDAGFVAFDDTGYVTLNPPVAAGLRAESLRWAVTGIQLANWHPLTWISHMADVELFGLEPQGPHAINLAFHALNVVLVFCALRSLTGDALPSFFVAGVLALHPANVESVAWIAQRKTLLSTAFALLSLWSYGRYARTGKALPYLGSLLGLALSLLSKPMFVTFPLLLLLLDVWPLRRRLDLGLLREKVPFALLAAGAVAVTLVAQREAMSPIEAYALPQRLANVVFAYVRYLGTFLAPVHLAAFYPLYAEDQTALSVGGSVALLLAISAGVLAFGFRRRWLLVGWLWFLGTLVPVIGLVQVGMQSMADRYVYVPYLGLAIALAWSGQELLHRFPARALRAGVAAGVVTLFCVWSILSYRQAETWHDGVTLFEHAIANTGRNWMAHGYLASVYFGREEFDRSIAHSEEALKHGRSLAAVRSTYGLALYETGEPERALEQFELATLQDPDDPIGYMNFGWMLTERGDYDRALVNLMGAASKIKGSTAAYTRKMIFANWASALEKTGQLTEAREKYDLALGVDPDFVMVLRDSARIDVRLRDPERAEVRLKHALELDPGDAEAAYLLASAQFLAGNADEAAGTFDAALARDPRKVLVVVALARTLAASDRADDAVALLEQLLARPQPPNAEDAQFVASTLHAHLAEIALEGGDLARGWEEIDIALEIWPDQYEANHRLAWLLATGGGPRPRDPARAVAVAEKVVEERREYASLATLAVAYAATGRVADAIAASREALALAEKARDARAITLLEQRLDEYARAAPDVKAPTP